MAFAANMIASLKLNNRRNKRKAFEKHQTTFKIGTPIVSKKFSQLEKDLLMKGLRDTREIENKQKIYKMIISFGLTIVVVSGIVFAIKYTFF